MKDLIGRLTLDEKLGLLGPDTTNTSVGACTDMDAGVPRLGIPGYTHLVEDNSGAGMECVGPERCPTNFPGPTGLASSFNRTAWRLKGEIISTEQRASNNVGDSRGYEAPFSKIGLTGFGPNINIARDPRFGRISELPSEDPVLTGAYATEMVKGMQEGESFPKYIKLAAALKHFTAYSTETDRMQQMFYITQHDLFDTYLPAYETAFVGRHGAMGAMCSYAGVNGVPMCGNDYILNQILRSHWKRPDAHIQSDCGAISNMLGDNEPSGWPTKTYAQNRSDAAAKALNGGCDLDDGNQFYQPKSKGGNGGLPDALDTGLTDIAHVDAALSRVLTNERFRTGQADPLEGQPYTRIDASAINATAHQDANLDMATQSMVLLRNEPIFNSSLSETVSEAAKALPLKVDAHLAVLGPHAVSHRDLLSDYIVDQLCWKGPIRGGDCWPTIGEAFTTAHTAGQVTVAQGVDMESHDRELIPVAIAAAKAADTIVLCLGIGNAQEHEGKDRVNTKLPGLQEEFAMQVLALGKPTVLVLVNGGIVSIDNILAQHPPHAIVEAFYPSTRGGEALYSQLSGKTNKWGKLPVTIYKQDFTEHVGLDDFNMTGTPGRTYRYYKGEPLYSFGDGLSLTEFDVKCSLSSSSTSAGGGASGLLLSHATGLGSSTVNCAVKNIGSMTGDEVLMLFTSFEGTWQNVEKPKASLIDFARVTIPKDAARTVSFSVAHESLSLTTIDGDRVVPAGMHTLYVKSGRTSGSFGTVVGTVNVTSPTMIDIVPRPPAWPTS